MNAQYEMSAQIKKLKLLTSLLTSHCLSLPLANKVHLSYNRFLYQVVNSNNPKRKAKTLDGL